MFHAAEVGWGALQDLCRLWAWLGLELLDWTRGMELLVHKPRRALHAHLALWHIPLAVEFLLELRHVRHVGYADLLCRLRHA
jgi:hypothetical protein